MKEVNRLAKELPPQAKIQSEIGSHSPIVLKVKSEVVFLEGNARIAFGYGNTACAVGAATGDEVGQCVEVKEALNAREKNVRRILIKELAAEGDGMMTDGPIGVVLYLANFDDAAVRFAVGQAEAGQGISVRQIEGTEIGW